MTSSNINQLPISNKIQLKKEHFSSDFDRSKSKHNIKPLDNQVCDLSSSEFEFFKKISNEFNQRELNSNKAVILGLSESQNDLSTLRFIFEKLNHEPPFKSIRLGELDPKKRSYPRPILCEFRNSYMVKSLLNKSSILKRTRGFENVYINKHLTKLQRIFKSDERKQDKFFQTKHNQNQIIQSSVQFNESSNFKPSMTKTTNLITKSHTTNFNPKSSRDETIVKFSPNKLSPMAEINHCLDTEKSPMTKFENFHLTKNELVYSLKSKFSQMKSNSHNLVKSSPIKDCVKVQSNYTTPVNEKNKNVQNKIIQEITCPSKNFTNFSLPQTSFVYDKDHILESENSHTVETSIKYLDVQSSTLVGQNSKIQQNSSCSKKSPVHSELKKVNSKSSVNKVEPFVPKSNISKINHKIKVYSSQNIDPTDLDYQAKNEDPKIVKAFGIEILQSDLQSLVSGLRLKDKILNFYINLICVSINKDTFASIDSLLIHKILSDNHRVVSTLSKYILCLKSASLWEISQNDLAPKQFGGIDCGVFACQYAKYFGLNKTFDFSQDNIAHKRTEILDRTRNGGGIIVFIKNSLVVTKSILHEKMELIYFQIKIRDQLLNFIYSYRPPSLKEIPFLDKLEEFMQSLNLNQPLFLIGDFNIDHSVGENNIHKFIDNNELINFVTKPTRIISKFYKKNNSTRISSTMIDLLLHNGDLVSETDVIECPFSDQIRHSKIS
ncbi:unnamed protein product [Brachionus calyciflorus]|uniref:Ubiquitin-like protease family profile domain-containing protein n=1 Tax=Brachionus calyciflorus TaxID=104777 RepID=A0A814PNP5_9BILA|nr:unnamed protein product [Brachionus calyciflorus]